MKLSPLTLTVLTDIHYYSKKSGTSGKAYDIANSKSQKLLAESGEVLQAAFDQIAADNRSDIVLICGDITNNGELYAHEEIIKMLRSLKEKGKKVYLITATHDFRDSGDTDAYDGDNFIKTPTALRDMLFDMYKEFGPDDAIAVHRDSMSYVVQLCDGYRLFALNDDRNLSGKSGFSDECFKWISDRAEEAKRDGQFIIAMTHHPLIAPSPIYEIIGKGDMLGDYETRIRQLADLGIQFILTGHTHIHNISAYQSEQGNVLYDICTASPIGYPGAMRTVTVNPEKAIVKAETDFVNTPESFKAEGRELRACLENQLIGMIKEMIKTAGEDIDKLAYMATSISIKPKLIYKFGWLIKPVFKLLNSLKVGTAAKWTRRENGLKKEDYSDIKDKKVVDVISELVLNLYGGESKYPPDTATYKITLGVCSVLDSILRILHIDLKKITKVSSTVSELVEPLLYNPRIDSYEAELKIFPYCEKGESAPEKLTFPEQKKTVKASRKGLPILLVLIILLISFLPLWLILLLFGFVKNQIKYRKELKS